MKAKKIKVVADRHSGLEGCLFTLSLILPVVHETGIRTRFGFPFYALTFDTETERVIEWIDWTAYGKGCDRIMEHLRKEGTGYFEYVQTQMRKEAQDFKEYAQKLIPTLSSLNEDELLNTFYSFMHRYIYSYGLGCITFPYESTMSERLSMSLAARYENVSDVMTEITRSTYKSFVLDSERYLEKINLAPEKEKENLADEYLKNFFFIDASYSGGPILTKEEVLVRAKETHPMPPTTQATPEKYDLTKDEEIIGKLFIPTEEIRDQRKMFNLIGSYTLFRFLDEAIRRTKFDPKFARRIWWFEYKNFFYDPDNLTTKLKERKETTILLQENATHYLEYMALTPRSTPGEVSEIKGMVASKGKVSGRVRIVLGQSQFGAFQKGEILVTESTRPDFMGIMRKAAAIVTDEGGITSHAAIVSRELGVPCIIGTKIAVQVLKDGDMVEVDAENGIVRKLT